MNYSELISQVLLIVGALVVFVNIVTEVIKKVFDLKDAKVINIFVTVLSIVLTVAVILAYLQFKAISLTWYIAFASIIVGFMVAYGAMFGYDKLLSYFKKKE